MSRPIRRTQAIAPFGPGAMVDFPGPVSLIHAGLDAWPFDETNSEHREFRIDDEKRLARRLGVDFFVQPPDFRRPDRNGGQQRNLNLMLPFLRFPLWHFCPRCGRMHKGRYHDRDAPVCQGPISTGADAGKPHPRRKTFQVRFIAACQKGHIQDFPWVEWVFDGNAAGWVPDGEDRYLRMTTMGSASLAGVFVQAEERVGSGKHRVVARRSLAGAFTTTNGADPTGGSNVSTALSELGANCTGINPVLAIGTELRPAPGNCGEPLFALLKSAANLYFPSVVSSIYIPDVDDNALPQEVLDLLDDRDMKADLRRCARRNRVNGLVSELDAEDVLKEFHPESTVLPEVLAAAANKHLLAGVLLDDWRISRFFEQRIKTAQDGQLPLDAVEARVKDLNWHIDPVFLLGQIRTHIAGSASVDKSVETDAEMEEASYRQQEYRVFSRDLQVGYPKTDLDIRGADLTKYGSLSRGAFVRIALLHKLRETRAFEGFSRIYSTGLTSNEQRALFMGEPKHWLPAIVVRGEGIFLQFSEARLQEWMSHHGADLDGRLSLMKRNLDALATRRHQELRPITPRFVLLHTFAHLLINQLVHDCGYGSASLRERIYSADGDSPMAGILIYTAAGDSEGTMGGLVRMGQSDRLEEVIRRALEKARWCSTDPVCIESKGQGPDNCNLAACHSCALLPETSCEEQNRLLDRGVVIGTIEKPGLGFFTPNKVDQP